MAELEAFLGSRTLVGFQLDATHLHSVLQKIIQEQRAQAQDIAAVGRRVEGLENAMGELQDFARRTSGLLDSLGSADEIRNLATHVSQLESHLTNVIAPELQEVRRAAEGADRRAANAASAADNARSGLEDVATAVNGMREDVSALSDNHRGFARELREATVRVDEVHRSRGADQRRAEEMAREAMERVDRVERDAVAKLMAELDEMNRRADDNFKAVEVAVRQFEDDSRRAKADIGNLRAELNSLDNDASHRINKIKEDADSKFAMLLQLMQSFERNSQLFEAHMAEAGRALQNPRAPSRAASEAGPTPFRGGGSTRGSTYNFSPQPEFAGTTAGRGDAGLL